MSKYRLALLRNSENVACFKITPPLSLDVHIDVISFVHLNPWKVHYRFLPILSPILFGVMISTDTSPPRG
jgi:hypothetical protein